MLATARQIINLSERFSSDKKGNVAIIFAFCLLPMIGLIGYATDFSIGLMAKRKLDAAADAAVLNAVSKSSNPNLDQPTQAQALASFNAALERNPITLHRSLRLRSSWRTLWAGTGR